MVAATVGATVVAQSEPRTALVIGNAAYHHLGALANPANDARDLAASLSALGFEVTTLIDATLPQMDEAVFAFGRDLDERGGVGLFYYAGHGVEAGGINYLMPVDQSIRAERELRYKAVAVNRVLDEMHAARNGTNIVILDACRDNPLPPEARSSSSGRGLSVVQAPSGSLVVYATSPGNVAQDGRGRNGVFTGALLERISTPGVNVMDMLVDVRREVMRLTRNEQTPWENSSLVGQFFFAGTGPSDAAPAGATGTRVSVAPEPAEPAAPTPTGPRLRVTPAFGSIALVVRTGGELYLDGELLGSLAAGQDATIDGVPTGQRRLEMRYGTEVETIVVALTANATASATFTYQPPPPTGSLRITSDPPGATVTIAGSRRGVTPLTIDNLTPGSIAYTLTLAGYRDETGRATVAAGATATARVGMQSTIPRAGLVAEYLFSGNANDTSGNANHGTVHGATLAADRFGNARGAYEFDGLDNRIEFPSAIVGVGNKSIVLWLRSRNPSDLEYMSLAGNCVGGSSDNSGIEIVRIGDRLGTQVGNGSTRGGEFNQFIGVFANSDSSADTFLAITQLGSSASLWINGTLAYTSTVSYGAETSPTHPFTVGSTSSGEYGFVGILDDVRIYNRALTEAEILALYHDGGWDQ